jgi:hypothetical protein
MGVFKRLDFRVGQSDGFTGVFWEEGDEKNRGCRSVMRGLGPREFFGLILNIRTIQSKYISLSSIFLTDFIPFFLFS